jgi:hypothetical protein
LAQAGCSICGCSALTAVFLYPPTAGSFPASIGLLVNVVTGVMLFIKSATKWGTATPFLVKMLLVIASVAVLWPLRSHVLRNDAGTEVSGNLRLLAIASILAWTGAVTAGRLLAYLVP